MKPSTRPDTKPDLVLSDLISETPPRKVTLRVSDVHPGSLTLLETLDIVDACGIESTDFAAVMRRGRLRDKAMLMLAIAWVVARRTEPDLTFEEVKTYQLDVIGEPRNDEKEKARAETVVAVAQLAGVSTAEAKVMTMQEIEALTDLKRKRTVSQTRPTRRRA